ncbi:hypothetical protein JCM19992_13350 [Thermostilla marina]
MSRKQDAESPSDQPTFEESLAELERIVARLESGELGLDESLAEYERGVSLLRGCHRRLKDVEAKIRILTGTDEDGEPVTEPFDDTPSTEESGTRKRRRAPNRRSASSSSEDAAP